MRAAARSHVLVLMLAFLPLGGCATLVGGGSHQTVAIESTPSQADFTVTSADGLQVASGRTPTTVRLPRKNEYQVRLDIDGYEPQALALTRGTNGWIWGNLLFGWIVGFGVDFLTGSAYDLEPSLVQVSLERSRAGDYANVRIYDESGLLIGEERLLLTPAGSAAH